jgi:hypothetical protein
LTAAERTVHSLCAPMPGVTCFHCCPPIRPARHDTMELREGWSAELRRNSRRIHRMKGDPSPIDGRSCWALGFLDREEKSVGCLLHPERNGGADLRHLVEFGEKCAREWCAEARVFGRLEREERVLCLACAPLDDSFAYSSRRSNPLFRLLAWEEELVRALLRRESGSPLKPQRLLGEYSPLFTALQPRVDGYWIGRLVEHGDWRFLEPSGLDEYLSFREYTGGEVRRLLGKRGPRWCDGLPMVHTHPIPLSLSRWLKFGVGIWRSSLEEMIRIQEEMEKGFRAFVGKKKSTGCDAAVQQGQRGEPIGPYQTGSLSMG